MVVYEGKPDQETEAAGAPDARRGVASDAKKYVGLLDSFLKEEFDPSRIRPDESDFYPRHKNLVRLVLRQSFTIFVLVILLVLGHIFLQPMYTYFMLVPGKERREAPLVALTEPNLTDQAVLSWVITSITEVMTYGFGDFDQRILEQQSRFTAEGWDGFVNSVRERGLRSDFKSRQLVLTTVPSDAPVIVQKGIDEEHDYTWVVELPIIMTYATNNNVQKVQRAIVRVTVARVPSIVNQRGLGIKVWKLV